MRKTFLITLFFALLISSSYVCSYEYTCVPIPISVTLTCPETVKLNEDFSISAKISDIPTNYAVRSKIIDKNSKNIIVDGVMGKYSNGGWVFSFQPISKPGDYEMVVYFSHPGDKRLIEKSCGFKILPGLDVSIGLKSMIIYANEDIVIEVSINPYISNPLIGLEVFVNDVKINANYNVIDKGGGKYNIIIKRGTITNYGDLSFKITVKDLDRKYDDYVGWKFGIVYTQPEVKVTIDAPLSAKVGESGTIKIITTDQYGNKIDIDYLEMEITYPTGGTGETYKKGDFFSSTPGVYEKTYTFKHGQNYYISVTAGKSGYKTGRSETNIAVSGGPVCGCDLDDERCDEGCPCDPKCQKMRIPLTPLIYLSVIILIILLIFIFAKKKK